jgi:homoserine dehydrogenase
MKVAVLGYGTVGSGVVEVICKNNESISKKAGEAFDLKYILDIRDFEDDPMKKFIVKDFNTILEDEEVGVIAEAMGGIEPALTFVKSALAKGKSVATSNKELVAAHGAELLQIARENGASFLFEASVGGGIPIIRPLQEALTGDEICGVTGILNGTTNFILTEMKEKGRGFDEVLKEAQELGYAERNPEADVEGHDACRKIAILASLAFGRTVDYKDIPTQGITNITKEDMFYADQMKHGIKLLGSCKKTSKGISASVEPVMVSLKHPLGPVSDVFNAIVVTGNMVDDVMFYGKGAGKLPTASAVVADMVQATKQKNTPVVYEWSREKVELVSKEEVESRYFVRVEADASYGAALTKEIFGDVEILTPLNEKDFGFITPVDKQGKLLEKIEKLSQKIKVLNKISMQK